MRVPLLHASLFQLVNFNSHSTTSLTPNVQALINKLDSLLERVKTVFIHALIIGRIKEQLKSVLIGKSLKRTEIINNLEKTFQHIQEKYKVRFHSLCYITLIVRMLSGQKRIVSRGIFLFLLNIWTDNKNLTGGDGYIMYLCINRSCY